MNISPCKNCQKRHMGCHSDCAAYMGFAKESALRRAKNLEYSHAKQIVFDGVYKTIKSRNAC